MILAHEKEATTKGGRRGPNKASSQGVVDVLLHRYFQA